MSERGKRGGKSRVNAMSRVELQQFVTAGGKARWAGFSKAQRSEAARKAVQARWARERPER